MQPRASDAVMLISISSVTAASGVGAFIAHRQLSGLIHRI
jgi:hypothetical protein